MKNINYIWALPAFALLVGVAASTSLVQATGQVDPSQTDQNECQEWPNFQNIQGGYSFDYPCDWKVSVNENNSAWTMFGPSEAEYYVGGVQIREFSGTLEEYVTWLQLNVGGGDFQAMYELTIDGVPALWLKYDDVVSGSSVILKKDDSIYSLYFNSTDTSEVSTFRELANTFKFTH